MNPNLKKVLLGIAVVLLPGGGIAAGAYLIAQAIKNRKAKRKQ